MAQGTVANTGGGEIALVGKADYNVSMGRGAAVMTAVVSVAALVVGIGWGTGAKQGLWRLNFSGIRGVHPGMSFSEVAQRWHVRFTLSKGSAPGCAIGSFKSDGAVGGALFQDGKFDAVWFERGATTPEAVRVGSPISMIRQIYGARLRVAPNLYDPNRPLYYVRGGPGSSMFLEFLPDRNRRVGTLGFGDRFVLVQEGCN